MGRGAVGSGLGGLGALTTALLYTPSQPQPTFWPPPVPYPVAITPAVLEALHAAQFLWGPEKALDEKMAICVPCAAVVFWAETGWERHRAGCAVTWPKTAVDGI